MFINDLTKGYNIMLTVKEFAKSEGKSVQAVYNQLKSKENQKKLEGHIFERMVSGKKVKFLDDEACKILRASSRQNETIVRIEDQTEQIKTLQEQNDALKDRVIALLSELSETQKKVLIAQEQSARIAPLESQISVLKQQVELEQQRTAEAEKKGQEAEERAEKLKGRSLWQRIRNIDV